MNAQTMGTQAVKVNEEKPFFIEIADKFKTLNTKNEDALNRIDVLLRRVCQSSGVPGIPIKDRGEPIDFSIIMMDELERLQNHNERLQYVIDGLSKLVGS